MKNTTYFGTKLMIIQTSTLLRSEKTTVNLLNANTENLYYEVMISKRKC